MAGGRERAQARLDADRRPGEPDDLVRGEVDLVARLALRLRVLAQRLARLSERRPLLLARLGLLLGRLGDLARDAEVGGRQGRLDPERLLDRRRGLRERLRGLLLAGHQRPQDRIRALLARRELLLERGRGLLRLFEGLLRRDRARRVGDRLDDDVQLLGVHRL
ncbi:MAG TPA: hypothetical protein VKG20_21540 [Methylomirabilota bacterium]|nr:hypothetical protein [Methylomirabilota bacterium]